MKIGTRLAAAAVLLLFPAPAAAQDAEEAPDVPFHMPVPDDWVTETIPFPLSFAPDLPYSGLEELRFAPGMFDPTADDFWTYAFVWWMPAGTEIDGEMLSTHLIIYFKGLTMTVASSQGFEPPEHRVRVHLDPAEGEAPGELRLTGWVETLDPFATREPVRMNVRVDSVDCTAQGHDAYFFRFSPQPESHPVWEILSDIREGFRCEAD